MKNISIIDIAKQATVAASTVSLVLNGKAKQARISDALAENIKRVADEMGYFPNQTAVSLRTGKTKLLGLIVENISDVFFAELAKFVEEAADVNGYKLVYCSTENNDDKGNELLKLLQHRQLDGFLIAPSKGMEKNIQQLLKQKKPVVLMDRYFLGTAIPHVLVDNYHGVALGLEHLIQTGCHHIAFITVDLDLYHMQDRIRSYNETLQKHGMPVYPVLKAGYKDASEKIIGQMTEFFNSHPKLDAVFFATNYLGVIGLDCFKRMGLKIPEQLSVICFDDHEVFRLHTPEITVISQPIKEIAVSSVKMLMAILQDKSPTQSLSVLEKAKLICRQSTKKIRSTTVQSV